MTSSHEIGTRPPYRQEWLALFSSAGFELAGVCRTAPPHRVIEGHPV